MTDLADTDLTEPPAGIVCDGTGREVIGCLVRSGLDDDEVVKAFCARPDALDLIGPLIRWYVSTVRRKIPKAAEGAAKRAAIANGSYRPPSTPPPVIPRPVAAAARSPRREVTAVSPELAASWRHVADVSVDIPDAAAAGGWRSVPWLDVTVEQHRSRADALRSSIKGTVDSIEAHERAAEDCERAGVRTLRDLIQRSGGGRAA